MNHIYKVIWSKAKHAYVVTSEVAKSHAKGASAKAVKTALAAAVGMSLFVGGVYGECGTGNKSGWYWRWRGCWCRQQRAESGKCSDW